MLTLNQIVKICSEGVEIRIKRKNSICLKGEFNPSTLEIILYLSNITSKQDLAITLLHELIHARDELIPKFNNQTETIVETEAKLTYTKKPYLIDFIKELYNLKH